MPQHEDDDDLAEDTFRPSNSELISDGEGGEFPPYPPPHAFSTPLNFGVDTYVPQRGGPPAGEGLFGDSAAADYVHEGAE